MTLKSQTKKKEKISTFGIVLLVCISIWFGFVTNHLIENADFRNVKEKSFSGFIIETDFNPLCHITDNNYPGCEKNKSNYNMNQCECQWINGGLYCPCKKGSWHFHNMTWYNYSSSKDLGWTKSPNDILYEAHRENLFGEYNYSDSYVKSNSIITWRYCLPNCSEWKYGNCTPIENCTLLPEPPNVHLINFEKLE